MAFVLSSCSWLLPSRSAGSRSESPRRSRSPIKSRRRSSRRSTPTRSIEITLKSEREIGRQRRPEAERQWQITAPVSAVADDGEVSGLTTNSPRSKSSASSTSRRRTISSTVSIPRGWT